MQRQHFDEAPAQEVAMEGAVGVKIRWLIGEQNGAPNFAMRHFEIAPGGRKKAEDVFCANTFA